MKLLPAALLAFAATGALAQTYPNKPIRIVAPAAAGSGTDLVARAIGQQISAALKQPVIVENKVGGGGTVGVDYVVKSAPDGYTLLLSTDATVAIQPHLSPVSYDTLTDLAPIGEISSFPLVVVAGNGTGIQTIADLARVARSNGKGVSYGMGGLATGGHIVGETIRLALGVPMTAVPYPSASRAVNDVLGGSVEVGISDALAATHVNAGKLKAVAVASKTRASCLEGVPTLAEQGIPFDLPYSYGLLAPAKTPAAIIEVLNRELNAALKSDAVRDQLKRDCQAAAPAANTPADFAQRLKYHHERWGALIRNAGIKLP